MNFAETHNFASEPIAQWNAPYRLEAGDENSFGATLLKKNKKKRYATSKLI